jgi:hypothetical protein
VKPQTTVRDEERFHSLDDPWKSEWTLTHFPLAEQPRLEMRHNAVVIEEVQASRYGEREDDRAGFVFIRRDYAARRCTQPRTKRAPASPTRPAVVISPVTTRKPAKASDTSSYQPH